eukprot:478921-Pyramimonas_sp.AAC.1
MKRCEVVPYLNRLGYLTVCCLLGVVLRQLRPTWRCIRIGAVTSTIAMRPNPRCPLKVRAS